MFFPIFAGCTKFSEMKSILGMGNALTDILAVLPDDTFLRQFHLPKGSMQHVDMETGDKIWQTLKPMGVQYVAGGSAANTITGTAIFGMESGFIGKVGDDELGHLFKSDQEQYGIKSTLLKGVNSSGRAMERRLASIFLVLAPMRFSSLSRVLSRFVKASERVRENFENSCLTFPRRAWTSFVFFSIASVLKPTERALRKAHMVDGPAMTTWCWRCSSSSSPIFRTSE